MGAETEKKTGAIQEVEETAFVAVRFGWISLDAGILVMSLIWSTHRT